MTDIKLVVTDVDGTLVQLQQHVVSQANRDAIIAAEAKDVKVVAVTGRPYEMVQPVLLTLGFDGLCVVDNGATIRNASTGELIWSQWLDVERVRRLVEILLPYSSQIDYEPKWNDHVPDPEVEMQLVNESSPYVFSIFPKDKQTEIAAALQAVPGVAYHFDVHSTDPTLAATIVTDISATKFHGVESLRKLLNLNKAETMAIGDGNNDLPLFENAGLKVAMGNATEELKLQADQIVADVNHDGFAEAMHKFVLS